MGGFMWMDLKTKRVELLESLTASGSDDDVGMCTIIADEMCELDTSAAVRLGGMRAPPVKLRRAQQAPPCSPGHVHTSARSVLTYPHSHTSVLPPVRVRRWTSSHAG